MTATGRVTKWFFIAMFAACAVSASAADKDASDDDNSAKSAEEQALAEAVTFQIKGRQQTVKGRTLVEGADGGILFQGVDGVLWMIDRTEMQGRKMSDTPFKPLTQAAMSEQMLAELPAGFRTFTTPHYVVCYNTSRAYAQWTSSLLERLYRAFANYWQTQGLELHEPEFPLPVVVFADHQSYDQASREDLPNGTGSIVGYYSMRSNRVNMFDLTGTEAALGTSTGRKAVANELNGVQAKGRRASASAAPNRRGSMREINQMLSQPDAVPLVATVVHEATHQIAFNCGMQIRYADTPLWLCEGMAVYFEAPDLTNSSVWRGIGRVNYMRLDKFRENLSSWHEGSLEDIVCNSKRYRDPQTAAGAYADAWALNYYLIKYEPKAYAAYLKVVAKKQPLIDDGPEKRLAEFRKQFGDLHKLEQDFLKQMSRVK